MIFISFIFILFSHSTELTFLDSLSGVVFVGEKHTENSHSQAILRTVEHLRDKEFTFSTEMVLWKNQKHLNAYLNDKLANMDTPQEALYFQKMGQGSHHLRKTANKEILRLLRELRLERGAGFKVCAVDQPVNTKFYRYSMVSRGQKGQFLRLAKQQKEKLEEVSELSYKELFAFHQPHENHLREFYMAKAATECISTEGLHIVHTGSSHGLTRDFVESFGEQKEDYFWRMRQWLKYFIGEQIGIASIKLLEKSAYERELINESGRHKYSTSRLVKGKSIIQRNMHPEDILFLKQADLFWLL